MSDAGKGFGTEIDFSLILHGDIAYGELRKIEAMVFRILGVIRRISGSEDLGNLITIVQRTISWLRQLQMMIHAIQIAEGPLGWAWAGVSALSFAMTTASAGGEALDSIRSAS